MVTAAAAPPGAVELQQDAAAHWARLVQQLPRENLDLAGRLGFYQAENLQLKSQVQAMQTRILESEVPRVAPTEMASHHTRCETAADSGTQSVRKRLR